MRLALTLTLVTALALFSLWVSPLTLWLAIGLSALVLLAYLYAIAQHALLILPSSVIQVHITAKGQCFIKTQQPAHEQANEVVLMAESVVHPYLTTLLYRTGRWRYQAVIISQDRVDAEAFRALRVWMLWAKEAKT